MILACVWIWPERSMRGRGSGFSGKIIMPFIGCSYWRGGRLTRSWAACLINLICVDALQILTRMFEVLDHDVSG